MESTDLGPINTSESIVSHEINHRSVNYHKFNLLLSFSGYSTIDYARSLEKFMMKQDSWDTASPGGDYNLYTYMDRVFGFDYDNSIVKWGCQLRELLQNRTGYRRKY